MEFKKISIILIQVLFSVSVFSQIDSTLKDPNKEITIYEYDTVYLQPDTIRLTNVIIDTIKTNPIKNEQLVSKNNHPFFSAIMPNSVGVKITPFISEIHQNTKISDSLYSQSVINTSFSIQVNYNYNKYILSIGAGFTPYHEKQHFKNTYYSSNLKSSPSGIYDSLLINKEYTANYYYNYLNLNIIFGREWKLNKKWYLSLNAGCIGDYLIGYKQNNTNVTESTVRKFDISLTFTPSLTYKINRNFEIYISPFYQHSLLDDKKNPNSSAQKMGIGVGFNKTFK